MKTTIRPRATSAIVAIASLLLLAAPAVADPPAESNELLAATRAATGAGDFGGPVAACFDQLRAFACPIAASIPVVRDVVGRLSLELGFSCPTRIPPRD